MALGLRKESVDDVLTVLAAVLIFNSLPKFQTVGQYFQQYPAIILGLGVAIIFFRQKIAEKVGT